MPLQTKGSLQYDAQIYDETGTNQIFCSINSKSKIKLSFSSPESEEGRLFEPEIYH